jgi:Ca2+-transporting ATPase
VTGNLSEILVVAAALVLVPGLAVPLLPVQLLWVNLVTDGLPALALGVDRSTTDPLELPPAPRVGGLLGRGGLCHLAARGAVVAGCVTATGVLGAHWGWTDQAIRTQMLLTLLAAHVLLAFPSRAARHSFERGWWRNLSLTAAVGMSLGLQLVAFGTPFGREVLDLSTLPASSWALSTGACLTAIGLIDLGRVAHRARTVKAP